MPLTFENAAQELTYRKVYDYLTASTLFRDAVTVLDSGPNFIIAYGSTRIYVDVIAWTVNPWDNPNLALVRSYSFLTEHPPGKGGRDLLRFLMQESSRIRFGAFQLAIPADVPGDHPPVGDRVMFVHSILGGENMDLVELQTCILSVAAIADTYDDLLVEKFGGHRIKEDDTRH